MSTHDNLEKLFNDHTQYVADELTELKLNLERVEDNTKTAIENNIADCNTIFVTKKFIWKCIYIAILISLAIIKISSDIGSAVNTALHDRDILIKNEIEQLHKDSTAQYLALRQEFNERLRIELRKRSVLDNQILQTLNTLTNKESNARSSTNRSD